MPPDTAPWFASTLRPSASRDTPIRSSSGQFWKAAMPSACLTGFAPRLPVRIWLIGSCPWRDLVRSPDKEPLAGTPVQLSSLRCHSFVDILLLGSMHAHERFDRLDHTLGVSDKIAVDIF